MDEIEAKILLNEDDVKQIVSVLGEPHFFSQKNTFYVQGSQFVRVREERGKTILTVKGARKHGKFNRRSEQEIVSQLPKKHITGLLELLSFQETLSYEKYRAEYLSYGCTVALDILPDGRYYLEVEGKTRKIEMALRYLNLGHHPIEKMSYAELLQNKCKGHISEAAEVF